MLTDEQAAKFKEAGLYAYNHNPNSSQEFYNYIISTRKYEDRLDTVQKLRDHNISVCCGGIIGMGKRMKTASSSSMTSQPCQSTPSRYQ